MDNQQKEISKVMRSILDTVIGGRYIDVAHKAEGWAIITSDALTAEDIRKIIAKVNSQLIPGDDVFREVDQNNWRMTPTNYRQSLYLIEKAPLTRKRYVEERTPLMELRLYYVRKESMKP